MSIATLTSIPDSIEAGTTTLFTYSDTNFLPADGWASFVILIKPGEIPQRINATVSGTKFLCTIAASTSAGWKAGVYDYGFFFTKALERGSGDRGKIAVLDNLAVAQPKSHAESMVEVLEKAVLLLGATTDASVSFNGQSFTQASIGSYRADLTFWKAAVIRERADLARLRGTENNGFVAINFG